jgi:hypothetical protein
MSSGLICPHFKKSFCHILIINSIYYFECFNHIPWENQEVKYDYNEEIKVRTGSHKKKCIVDIDEKDEDIVVERPASTEDPGLICPTHFKKIFLSLPYHKFHSHSHCVHWP